MVDEGQWQVAGNAAETYEDALVPAVFAPWAPLVVALADPRAGERVLDVACGTGVVARLAAQRVGPAGSVTGLDLNPGMLAVAASIAAARPTTSAPITWQEASATNMPLPAGTFDVVYCQLGLQFFPDRPRRTARDVSRAGTWRPPRLYGVAGHPIQSWVQRLSRCAFAARQH
ncbi:class I SAM-dependent methyltransferase [Bradyrhizobium sp. USDA 4502]